MADSTAIDLSTGTPSADTALVGQNTSAATRMENFAYSTMGGLVLSSDTLTTANLTASVGTLHQLTIAGLTANRDFILPDTAAVGERIALYVVDGDPSFEVEIKTAASGSTINGTDYSTNEWSRVFIASEVLLFRCTVSGGAGATDWVVENDGRIQSKCAIADRSGAVNHYTDNVMTLINADTTDFDVGGLADLTNDRIKIRRDGHYMCAVRGLTPFVFGDSEVCEMEVRKTTVAQWRSRANPSAAANSTLALIGSVLLEAGGGDYLDFGIKQRSGASITWSTAIDQAPSISLSEVLP